ncbi:hypothetical protein Nepgr_023487 [Nepenthes gracilis]|uniref:Uncharacterized protein n=1 Tax=Nepenthes gracilis TaxID=150966 RepID=A0AAD3XZ56_NEPGR|nr:hypothetical protein Nepgr_023487 [Nepenthes gracilis]
MGCTEMLDVLTISIRAIANLFVNTSVAKVVAEKGEIAILANLARSMNRLVAGEAAGGLWNLSVGEEHKGAITEAGGVKALVDLIFKWSSGDDGVLESAAGALANLATDDKCSMEVALTVGVHALVMLARSCKSEGVQELCLFGLNSNMSQGVLYVSKGRRLFVHCEICHSMTETEKQLQQLVVLRPWLEMMMQFLRKDAYSTIIIFVRGLESNLIESKRAFYSDWVLHAQMVLRL